MIRSAAVALALVLVLVLVTGCARPAGDPIPAHRPDAVPLNTGP